MYYQRIKYFLRAAETGSFKKAADQLYISPPALAKQINLLEEDLGGKLFERTPYGVTLTELGKYAVMKLDHVDNELTAALSDIQVRSKRVKPRINIGIFSSLPQNNLVSPFVSFMLSGFPGYQINLNMVELEQGKLLMMHHQIDFLLTNTHAEDDWSDFSCLSFGAYEAKVVVSLLHPWAIKDAISLEDMKQETFLKMHMEADQYILPREQSFYENVPCKRVQEVSNFNTMFTLLGQGESFAIFPEAFAFREQAQIKCFDLPGQHLLFHTALIYNQNSEIPGIQNIAQSIEEEFELKRF